MPARISGFFELNPHLLSCGSMRPSLPDGILLAHGDCTGPTRPGGESNGRHLGVYIDLPRIPKGKWHHFYIVKDPKRAALNFTAMGWEVCVSQSPWAFNPGNDNHLHLYAGSTNDGRPACLNVPIHRPIRACPTVYGWLIEVDSGGDGTYDMTIACFDASRDTWTKKGRKSMPHKKYRTR